MESVSIPKKVRKRDGSLAKFDKEKIENAIAKAAYQILHQREKEAYNCLLLK